MKHNRNITKNHIFLILLNYDKHCIIIYYFVFEIIGSEWVYLYLKGFTIMIIMELCV